jgi:hypothetical protein
MRRPSSRSAVLGVLLLCGGSVTAAMYQQNPDRGGRQGRGADGAQVIQVDKLKDNLFVLRGAAATRPCSSGPTASPSSTPRFRGGDNPAREDQGTDRQADRPHHSHYAELK